MKTKASTTTQAELPSVRSEPLLEQVVRLAFGKGMDWGHTCAQLPEPPCDDETDVMIAHALVGVRKIIRSNASADRPAAPAGTVRPDVGLKIEGKRMKKKATWDKAMDCVSCMSCSGPPLITHYPGSRSLDTQAICTVHCEGCCAGRPISGTTRKEAVAEWNRQNERRG